MSRGGFVLVGGRSTRMGRDKAMLPVGGQAMAAYIATQVNTVAGHVALVGSGELYAGLGFRVIEDDFPGQGPLGGVITALRHSEARWNLVVACDMPLLNAALLERLFAPRALCTAAACGGDVQPLCAVWDGEALPRLEAMFAGGVRKMHQALAGLRAATVDADRAEWLRNLNTAEEWEAHCAGGLPPSEI